MTSSTKTTTRNDPPDYAKGGFEMAGKEGQELYKAGSGANTYLGNTVAPLSGTTMQGVNQLANAGANWDTSGTRPLFQGIGAASVGPSSASENLQGYASGEYLQGEGNPFYRQRLEKEIADSNDLLRSTFSGMGRYGSDVSQKVIGENTSDMLYRGLEDDFNRQTQNQFNAVNMLDQQRNLGLDRGLAATGAMAGLDQQQFANRLQGADATLQAGGILDQQAQANIMDEVNRFYALDNEDWTRLGMLTSAMSGAAGPYGTQMSQSRTSNPMGALSALGGGIGGAFKGKG